MLSVFIVNVRLYLSKMSKILNALQWKLSHVFAVVLRKRWHCRQYETHLSLDVKCWIFVSDLNRVPLQIFVKVPIIKFYANPTNGSCAVASGETGRRADMTKLIGPFRYLCESLIISRAFDQIQWHFFNPVTSYEGGSKSFRPDIQRLRQMENSARDI